MNTEWRTRYDMAVSVTREAGDLAKKYFESSFDVEIKADASPVTIADRKAEELIRAHIAKHFPQDGFLGEEFGDQPGSSGFRWVIDPIDGTKSFIRQVPLWGTLVGLEYKGEQIAGICYAPGLNQLWRALRGDGAYRDQQRIHVSSVNSLSGSLFCYSSISWFRKEGRENAFLELTAKTGSQRGYGDFYGFVLVAQGSAELMIDSGLHYWDSAAPRVIVQEAGGSFTNWKGEGKLEAPDVLASNGLVHNQALQILSR